eukprot:m.16042 g.16042  ORF g.16042 m.16042 type:complete len:559 (-) comp10843_c0_seq1:245-1921(-)
MAATYKNLLNINVGVLGHVDSGKTSLARALSTVASTAAFDKNPQSKERGITLDLGFSSFQCDLPEHLATPEYDGLQLTLVDCPGHASLIKTIIGGAQIIDIMILVIDINKGIQTQTAECIVIGEVTSKPLIIVLNKIDMIDEATREKKVASTKAKLAKVFAKTKFIDPQMVAVSARPGGPESATPSIGLTELVATLMAKIKMPKRDVDGPFRFAVDHCFAIKGQGTVMTGTVLNGTVRVGDEIELPLHQIVKKVKSMQMFRKPCQKALMGDRVGICLAQLDAKLIERGVLCKPKSLPAITAAVCSVDKIRFYKDAVKTKAKFHLSVGHATVMCTATFFGSDEGPAFDAQREYHYQEELYSETDGKGNVTDTEQTRYKYQFAVLEFESKIGSTPDSLVIGSRLDKDINSASCRLAFSGKMLAHTTDENFKTTFLPTLRVFKPKIKSGTIDTLSDEQTVIGKNLFSKDTAIEKFFGLKVSLSTGEEGVIDSKFGESGKYKVRVSSGLLPETVEILQRRKKSKKKGKGGDAPAPKPIEDVIINVTLQFKRFIFDDGKKLTQ